MRALAFATLTAGILTTALGPASAASFVENFTISVSGETDTHFLSTPFARFDPKLGTLLSVSEAVSGPLTWSPGDSGEMLLLVLEKTGTSQFFFSSGAGDSQVINVDLNGAGGFQDPAFVGFGTTQESLAVAQSPGSGTLSGDSLAGKLTFTYTPAPAPEASTWAMMLLGLAALGFARIRQKGAGRSALS